MIHQASQLYSLLYCILRSIALHAYMSQRQQHRALTYYIIVLTVYALCLWCLGSMATTGKANKASCLSDLAYMTERIPVQLSTGIACQSLVCLACPRVQQPLIDHAIMMMKLITMTAHPYFARDLSQGITCKLLALPLKLQIKICLPQAAAISSVGLQLNHNHVAEVKAKLRFVFLSDTGTDVKPLQAVSSQYECS